MRRSSRYLHVYIIFYASMILRSFLFTSMLQKQFCHGEKKSSDNNKKERGREEGKCIKINNTRNYYSLDYVNQSPPIIHDGLQ